MCACGEGPSYAFRIYGFIRMGLRVYKDVKPINQGNPMNLVNLGRSGLPGTLQVAWQRGF